MLGPHWDETCLRLQNQPLAALYTTLSCGGRSRIRTWVGLRRDLQSVYLDVCQ
jgi:hypothetical protein